MDGDYAPQDGQLPLHGPGERLRLAREAAGMTVAQVAAQTRIASRYITSIEQGDFGALPARTYATGFARSYARAVGLDEREVVEAVRQEVAASQPGERHRAASFEPGDPARVPSRKLAWFSLFALALLIAGIAVFYNRVLAPGAGPPSLLDEQRAAARAAPAPAAAAAKPAAAQPTSGPVVFTALEDGVWVKFYDGAGQQLMQKQMAKGESYTVPADAKAPQLWTGRPDALAITVGGQPVARLAEREGVMKDVAVTAEALRARAAPAPATAPSPGAT